MAQLQAQYIVANNQYLRERIPAETIQNLPLFFANLKADPKLMNEFLTDMVDKIALQSVIRQSFDNPLSIFKKGDKPLGRFVENIHVNPVKAEVYDPNATTLLTVREPDVATEYFQRNRRDKYPITINKAQMQAAFTSWENLDDLIQEIVNSIYTGAYIDEWTLMKNVFEDFNAQGKLITVENDMTDLVEGSKSMFKALKTYSKNISMPTTKFNSYTVDHEDLPRLTWTKPSDQIILIRSDVATAMDVEYLAGVFNLSKVETDRQIIEVPDFGVTADGAMSKIQAVICDRAFLRVWDDLTELRNFDNPETLNFTYFYHVWQTIGLSTFANHIAIVDPAEEPAG